MIIYKCPECNSEELEVKTWVSLKDLTLHGIFCEDPKSEVYCTDCGKEMKLKDVIEIKTED